ncbi:peroxidase-like [Condylostylus longicornis]|uniref:peroxidase-like n=1 Tax=Condylostylus longicornis TaxID=2530218 RepID=UPI00244DC3DC|nr:peroxidase-like [Condylostylus longicornis]
MKKLITLVIAVVEVVNSVKVSTANYNIIHHSPNRRHFAHSTGSSKYYFGPKSFYSISTQYNPFGPYANSISSPFASPTNAQPLTAPQPSGGIQCAAPPFTCPKSPYRTFDGSCNNLQNPVLGAAMTRYSRLLSAKYGDGQSTPTRSVTGEDLPNARLVSLVVFGEEDVPDPEFTLHNMQWGQIITHDMSMQAGGTQSKKHSTQCCTEDGQLIGKGAAHKTCYPIIIPQHDPAHSQTGTQCMEFVRTLTDRDVNCPDATYQAEQLTVVTSYMDLSLVYGNSVQQNAALRTFQGGRMIVDERNGAEWLPQAANATAECDAQIPNEICYMAGDTRVNQNPGLTVLQTILLREHNRIADELSKINPHYDDETLFQEARKISIGQYQHISYYEWLPIFLGTENMLKNRLIFKTGPEGAFINDYDPSIDPSVINSHATAAFRYFHSQIEGRLDLITELRSVVGALRLSDWFNRPGIIEINDNFDDLTRGHATQPEELTDINFDREIKHFLFRGNRPFGADLRAIDIQRNRDHGLASYNDFREFCGLPRAYNWDGYLDLISPKNVENLKSLYASVDDVDVTVGGSLETHVAGALAGPTFLCILTEQFYRTRVGDRFFYEHGDKETGFTTAQLAEIRKASMARLLCDNGNHISSMQPAAFLLVSKSNPVISCSDIPSVDLKMWQNIPFEKQYLPSQFYSPTSH